MPSEEEVEEKELDEEIAELMTGQAVLGQDLGALSEAVDETDADGEKADESVEEGEGGDTDE